jgi:hypothetical protein
VAFALGCLISWQATRMSFREQQAWLEESSQHSYPKEQKLRATVARLVGRAHAESESTIEMLCEIKAMYSVSPGEPSKMAVNVLEDLEEEGTCKNYHPALN